MVSNGMAWVYDAYVTDQSFYKNQALDSYHSMNYLEYSVVSRSVLSFQKNLNVQ